jgi:hypothetical protein
VQNVPSPPAEFPAGAVLGGRYRVVGVLGRGGMGTVYHCREDALEADWAVKELSAPPGEAIAHVLHEARILARLRHSGLPRVAAVFEHEGTWYLVMDRIQGETLAQRLERGRLDVQQSVQWLDAMLDILAYLHGQQPPVLFRDVTPRNVMLDEAGRLFLIDFGLARLFAPQEGTRPLLRGYGSAGYAPPEQYGHASTDARADLYSVAATAYHMMSGASPPDAVARLVGQASLEPLQVLPGLRRWVDKGLAIKADDRFQSASEMRQALRRAATVPHHEEHGMERAYAARLGKRLEARGWSGLRIVPEPFVAAWTRQQGGLGLVRAVAYVHCVAVLSEDEMESAVALAREVASREPPLLSSTSFIILAAGSVPNPTSIHGLALRNSSQTRGPRAMLLLPLDTARGQVLDDGIGAAFTNSNDLSDLMLNARIAAREPA